MLFKARKRIQVSGHIPFEHILSFRVSPRYLNLKLPYLKKKCRYKISSLKNVVTGKIARRLLPTNSFAWLSENIN